MELSLCGPTILSYLSAAYETVPEETEERGSSFHLKFSGKPPSKGREKLWWNTRSNCGKQRDDIDFMH